MKSIRELFRIGYGPSSSHTMGPRKAAEIFRSRHPEATRFEVTLYGSLAATGKGHMTDVAIQEEIPGICIDWEPKTFLPFHPNGMNFRSFDARNSQTDSWTVFSVGGGAFDPVCGLVQIPCIERNAYAAARALDANIYSTFTDGVHRVSFDKVVAVMKQTGHDLPSLYKETGEGGLAKDYHQM